MATRMQQRRGTEAQWTNANPVLNAGEIGFEIDNNRFKIGDGINHWDDLPYFSDNQSLTDLIDGAPELLNTLNELAAAIGDDPAFFTTTTNNLAAKAPLASPTFTGTVVLPANTVTRTMMSDDSVGTGEILGGAVTNDKIADATITNAKISETAAIATYKIAGLDTALGEKAPLASPSFTGTVSGVTKAHVGLGNVDNTSDANKPVSTAQAAAIATAKSEAISDATSQVNAVIASAPAALNTLDELAAALGDDANFATTVTNSLSQKASLTDLSDHNSDTLNVHGIANTEDLATQDYVLNQIANSTDEYPTLAGNGLVWDAVDGEFDVDTTVIQQRVAGVTDIEIGYLNGVVSGIQDQIDDKATPSDISDAITTHENLSINVHGIADTSLLATMSYADGKVDDHNALTTNIHGIASVADLATKQYADDAVLDHNNTTENVHGIVDVDELATKAFAAELLTQASKTNITITGDKNGLTITAENGVADSTTDNLIEGSNNKYFTDERAQDAVGNAVGTGLSYNDATGAVSVDTTAIQVRVADVSDTEIGYLNGVTSSVQTQLNAKSSDLSAHTNATTNVHGIANTADLATKSYADQAELDAIDAAAVASELYTDAAVAALTKSSVGLGNVDNTSDANKPVSTAAQTALNAKLNLSGGTMTGALTLSGAPTSDLHAATKAYVDNVTAGINFHEAVHAASTVNISANYSNGTSGVGATLTADTNRAFSTLDGESVALGQRVLIKNQTDAKQNGIYTLTTVGSVSAPWVLTRATDSDNNPTGEMKTGDFTFVQNGTVNASVGYINNSTANPIVIGTDNISYTEFNAGKTVIAGSGLTEATPGTLSIATGGVTSGMIADGTIVDADINASAAIAQSKISGLSASFDLKANLAGPTFTGTVTIPNGASLGTPASATLTNATGLPVSSGISGLGTGVATFLATPSSANLASMLTDEIGTGNVVLSEVSTNAQTASYTLVAADRGKLVEMNVGSANTLTVPLNSSVPFPIGTQIDILQVGSGKTTVAGATVGVTINATPGLAIRAQWGGATLIKRAENTWVLIGDLTTA